MGSNPKRKRAANKQPGYVRVRNICLTHADDLLSAARSVLAGKGQPNIAFHLAVLALEEIGKAGILSSRGLVGNATEADSIIGKLDDHVWKLQYAIWSPSMDGGRIDPKDFEEARELAQILHSKRLLGLYVDDCWINVGFDLPASPDAGRFAYPG